MDEDNNSQQKNATWAYNPEDKDVYARPAPRLKNNISTVKIEWNAVDAIFKDKTINWYLALFAITIGLSGLIILLTKDKMTAGVILVSGLLIGLYGSKKPRTIHYELTEKSIYIDGREHPLNSYKSFSILQAHESSTALLAPLKRLEPYTYVSFSPEIQNEAVEALSGIMPREMVKINAFDRLLRSIGF